MSKMRSLAACRRRRPRRRRIAEHLHRRRYLVLLLGSQAHVDDIPLHGAPRPDGVHGVLRAPGVLRLRSPLRLRRCDRRRRLLRGRAAQLRRVLQEPEGVRLREAEAPIKLCGMTCAEVIPYGTDDPHCPLTWSAVAHAFCGQAPPEGCDGIAHLGRVPGRLCRGAAADIKICGQTCAEVIPSTGDPPSHVVSGGAHSVRAGAPGLHDGSFISDMCPDACAAAPPQTSRSAGVRARGGHDNPRRTAFSRGQGCTHCAAGAPGSLRDGCHISDVCPDTVLRRHPCPFPEGCSGLCGVLAWSPDDLLRGVHAPECGLTWSEVHVTGEEPPSSYTMESFIFDVCPAACGRVATG